jgi:hypothetical protein
VDRRALGERQIVVDCDVIQADGGTRCASITGGWVALRLAVNKLMKAGLITTDPIMDHVAAVSCGIYAGQPVLDLDYAEDSEAGTDGNFVMTGAGRLIEVQMSAEGATFSRDRDEPACWIWPRRASPNWSPRRRPPSACGSLTEKKLLVATHNAGKLAEMRALLAPLRDRGGRRGRNGPARAGRDRGQLSSAMPASRPMPPCRRPGCRRWPMTAASPWTGWAARPASIPPIGPKPERPRLHAGHDPHLARAGGARRPDPAPPSSAPRWS